MTTETEIAAWLATQQDAMVALRREMVDIDSGSYNKPGIDAVGAVVQRFMQAQGIPVETSASRSTATACAPRFRGTAQREMPAAISC